MRKRRMDVGTELNKIIKLAKRKSNFTFKDVRLLSGFDDFDNQKKWAVYRINELLRSGEVIKIKRSLYKISDSSANSRPSV